MIFKYGKQLHFAQSLNYSSSIIPVQSFEPHIFTNLPNLDFFDQSEQILLTYELLVRYDFIVFVKT